jgi:CheY-like chemotaxis protein
VDDEAFIREVTRRTLETHGYRVLTAKEGREALAIFAQYPGEIRAVLTDLMMPGMNGAAMIEALLALDPQVRIIAVTGQPGNGELAGVNLATVQAILPKPYKVEKLLHTLAEVLVAESKPRNEPEA